MINSSNTIHKIALESKLPNLGMTIFSTMSALAKQHNAVNLGQGFPDFDCDTQLIDAVSAAMQEGHNQYPLMTGVPQLRHAISKQVLALYGHQYDADQEITITAGATQAIFTAILSCVRPGDEVIILEPAYDSYIPAIELAGGVVKPVSLAASQNADGTFHYAIPFDTLAKTINQRTRLLIINTPHNPTATIWTQSDMLQLQQIVKDTNVLICSDEVYEHMVFDGNQHESIARYPELVERSFVISSFGKTYHVTGWKVGYVLAPAWLSLEFRKVHQFNVFTVNSAMQHGIASYMTTSNQHLKLAQLYQDKRNAFAEGIRSYTKLNLLPCQGSYFQCVDYRHLSISEASLGEKEFAEWLTSEIGVAAIPLSAFYSSKQNSGIIRFCFAKKEATLQDALHRLRKL